MKPNIADVKSLIIKNEPAKAFKLLKELPNNYPYDTELKIELLKICTERVFLWRRLKTEHSLRDLFELAEDIASAGKEAQIYFCLGQLHEFCYDIDVSHEYFLKYMSECKSNTEEYKLGLSCVSVNSNFNGLLSDEEYINFNSELYELNKSAESNHRLNTNTDFFKTVRVALISYDFATHPIGMFISSLFPQINVLQNIEIYCYYTNDKSDDITSFLINGSACFKFVGGLNDGELANELINDAPDIIIDLSNRSNGNRLSLLSRRFAPVQMTWLGFPFTTATPNIDCNIGDEYLDSPSKSTQKFLTEKIIHMKPSYICYGLNLTDLKVSDSPPCVKNGYITFGNMSQPNRHSKQSLKLWKSVMDAVPNSILCLKFPLNDIFAIEKYKTRLARNGLRLERIKISQYENLSGYLDSYKDIDIILDTAPYNGCSTLFDSFMTGTPTVSLKGEYRQSRHCMLLNHVRLGDLIAENDGEYVQIASRLSQNIERLTEIKKTLPDAFSKSPLYNKHDFQKAFENMIRQAYLKYCFENKKQIYTDKDNPDLKSLLSNCLRAENIIAYAASEGEQPENLWALIEEYFNSAKLILIKIADISEGKPNILKILDLSAKALQVLGNASDLNDALNYIKPINDILKILPKEGAIYRDEI